jgi:hypothetical protein
MDMIIESIEENHKAAFRIIQYFFSCLDLLIVAFMFFLVKFYIVAIIKLLCLMVLDILIRIIKLYTYSNINSFSKEFFLTIFTLCQFLLIISIFNSALVNSENNYLIQSEIGFSEYVLFSLGFFFIVFPFEKLYFEQSNAFYIFKCILLFIFLFIFYRYIMNKFRDYLDSIQEKTQQNVVIFSIMINMPSLAFYSFCAKIFLYLIESGFRNKLFLSYLDMAQITLNEAAKYSIVLVLGSLLYLVFLDTDFNREKYDVTINQNID